MELLWPKHLDRATLSPNHPGKFKLKLSELLWNVSEVTIDP